MRHVCEIFFKKAFSLCGLILFVSAQAFALNDAAQTFTLDGKLYQSGTTSSLLDNSVKITVSVIDPSGKCVLYEEEQTVNTHSSDGYFHINVGSNTGSGKRTVNDPGRTMAQIFQNISAIPANSVSGQTCPGSSYTPTAGAVRYFRIAVTPSSTGTMDILSPDIVIDSVPQAMVAQSVQGLERVNILQTNTTAPVALSQTNLEALFTTPAYGNLQTILNGNFMKSDSSGAALPSFAATPGTAAIGDIWYDSTTNQVKYLSNSGVQTVGAGGGGGGISSLTVGSSMSLNGSVAGTISSGSGTIDLTNTGVTPGTYTKLTVDAKGRVTSAASITSSDVTTALGYTPISGGSYVAKTGDDMTGTLSLATGTAVGISVVASPTSASSGAIYVTSNSAVGNSIYAANTGVGGTAIYAKSSQGVAVDISSGSSGAAARIANTGMGTGLLSSARLGSSGYFVSSSAANTLATLAIVRFDNTSAANLFEVQDETSAKLVWIDSTGILHGNGSALTNVTANSISGTLPVNKGGTNATSFGNNHVIVSNGTGTALTDATCSLNQVLSFDASGYAVCSNVSSLIGAILNGGNTTGADISIGTNDNKALAFKVNNATAMTISQGKFVGIGATAPATKLDVRGSYAKATFASENVLQIGTTDAASPLTMRLGLNTHPTASMHIGTIDVDDGGTKRGLTLLPSGGNVGVGTGVGQPWTTFHVHSTPGSQITVSSDGDTEASLVFTNDFGSGKWSAIGMNGSAGGLRFSGNNTGNVSDASTQMVLTPTGNVGVGTLTPSSNTKLEVVGAAASRANIITSGNAVNLSLSNVHVLKSVGSSTIALSNMTNGGSYTLIVSDTTQTTYTFTGCTNTYFSPTNGQTFQRSTYTILTVIDTGVTDCYISWVTGFQ